MTQKEKAVPDGIAFAVVRMPFEEGRDAQYRDRFRAFLAAF